jgi:hypothetical protein
VDARLHYVQSEAEFVTPAELLTFLSDFYKETLDVFNARQAVARSVAAYDANNAYQQVIGRQEVHLQWLADAIIGLGGTVNEVSPPEQTEKSARERDKSLIEADARGQKVLIDRWTPLVSQVRNARISTMLELVLGEMKEHLRLLQQAAEGRTDLLGRHSDGKVLRGEVIAARPKN